jgi:hypothetical protein
LDTSVTISFPLAQWQAVLGSDAKKDKDKDKDKDKGGFSPFKLRFGSGDKRKDKPEKDREKPLSSKSTPMGTGGV